MAQVNEGAYRISGRFGEGFYIDPSGRRAPFKIVEATLIEFTYELGNVEVPLSGNRTGSKDGPEEMEGNMTVQQIDTIFERIILDARSGNLDERRRARDEGRRIPRTFTLQVWQDDPEALGAIGWQLEGVRMRRVQGGFNYSDEITNREYPFRFDDLRQIKAFERIGNEIDPVTGLPKIRFTANIARA